LATIKTIQYEVIMNHINCHETIKTPKKSKNIGRNPQELYDQYIRKGDEAIIAEDIILAEKYYQHADHYLRLMNDPHLVENDPKTQVWSSSCPIEQLIAKSLKGITAERAARKEAFTKKAREALKNSKIEEEG
jgi:predicted NAD-dependent protein-ADP-ribosyltransferase YbiA (DUF1768 family)